MTTVSYATTPQEFRDEIVAELRRLAARRRDSAAAGHGSKLDREKDGARANELAMFGMWVSHNDLAMFAMWLSHIEFHRKPELTRTDEEAQPEIELRPNGFNAASLASRG